MTVASSHHVSHHFEYRHASSRRAAKAPKKRGQASRRGGFRASCGSACLPIFAPSLAIARTWLDYASDGSAHRHLGQRSALRRDGIEDRERRPDEKSDLGVAETHRIADRADQKREDCSIEKRVDVDPENENLRRTGGILLQTRAAGQSVAPYCFSTR